MRHGKLCYVAKMKRDNKTTWKITVVSVNDVDGHKLALDAWVQKFTGKNSSGFDSDCKAIARGNDADGCCWVLQPKRFH